MKNTNMYIYNKLEGNKKGGYAYCTCGQEGIIPRDTDYDKRISMVSLSNENEDTDANIKCIKCGAPLIHINRTLTFDKYPINKIFIDIKPLNKPIKACTVEIDIIIYNLKYKINFSKKKIEIDNKSINNKYFKIIFDGTLKPEDMYKIYEHNNENELKEIEYTDLYKKILEINNINLYKIIKKIDKDNLDFAILDTEIPNTITNVLSLLDTKLQAAKKECIKNELIVKSGLDYHYLKTLIKKEEATNPVEQLGIKPYLFKYLKKYGDVSIKSLMLIDSKLKDKAVHFLETFKDDSRMTSIISSIYSRNILTKLLTLIIEADISIKKIYKYLTIDVPLKQGLYDMTEIIGLLYDSYELAKILELPFDKTPKTLQKYHDILTREYKIVEDQVKNKQFIEVSNEYKHLEYKPTKEKLLKMGDIEEKVEVPEKYCMKIPYEIQDLIAEGKNMRHCVGSYVDRVIKKNNIIVFMREQEKEEESYATIELVFNNNSIDKHKYELVQLKGKCNTRITDKEAIKFIHKWCKLNDILPVRLT